MYPAAGHVITGNLRIISDSRIRSMIAKGPKYRFPVHIDFQKCREKIAASLNEYCNRWCKREHVECDALKDWKLNIFKIIDRRIVFYSHNTNMLPCQPKISYRYLKSGIEEFHSKSRRENPQKLTQLSSRSHPRHLEGKRTAQKDTIIDITSDSQVNSNFPSRWSPASLTFNNKLASLSWFQQIKLQTTLLLFDGCTTLIL